MEEKSNFWKELKIIINDLFKPMLGLFIATGIVIGIIWVWIKIFLWITRLF